MQETSGGQQELWRRGGPRLFSDADVARLFGVSPGYVPKLREKGWLPKRKKVGTGKAGGKGVQRYSFLETVAAEVARIASTMPGRDQRGFGLPLSDVRRMVSIITSNDKEAVSAAKLVAFKDPECPGAVRVVFLAPEEVPKLKKTVEAMYEIVSEEPLLAIVEYVANILYDKMVAAGFEFSGVAAPVKKKKARGRRS